MITTINEMKTHLINENFFNINDIKYDSPLYQEILDLGFTDNTSDIQYKRGNLSFMCVGESITPQFNKSKNANRVEYIIYANGKLRMSSPGYYTKSQHITYDLNKSIENMEELTILFEKTIKSILRLRKR